MIENCYLIIRPSERKRTPDWYETDETRTSIRVYDPVFEASKLIAKKMDGNRAEETKDEKGHSFEKFTKILGPSSSIHEIYIASSISDYVKELFEGRNHLCLFYGQTSSGKTFNLMGENNFDLEKSVATSDRLDNPQDTRGLIVRMVKNLFKEITRVCEGDKDREENFIVTVNFYDLYLDKIRDIGKYVNEQLNDWVTHDVHSLTVEQIEKHYINIQEKSDGSIVLKNLTNIEVQSPKDMAFIIDKGIDVQEVINRKLNCNSSVSHTILSLTFKNDEDDKVGKVWFIRCAGSEWNSKNPSNDQRGEESIILNNSFNTLSKIVNLLKAKKYAEENKEKILDVQLSYQDSKFTRILQGALNPDYKLTVFATLHSGDSYFNESLQTLRYCNKIRGISLATSNKCMFSQKMLDGEEDEEQLKNEAMLNKITMENLELKGYIENQKVKSIFYN